MCKYVTWIVAILIFAIVQCGLFHAGCRLAVFSETVAGLLVGAVHGLLHIYCVWERSKTGRSLTAGRVKKIVLHSLRMDTCIGLLIGVVKAVFEMLGR